jgi:hypothetical protein
VKKLIKLILLLLIFGVIVATASIIMSKEKLSRMTDDEIREFLAARIGDKVGAEQLSAIQTAVIGGVRGRRVTPGTHENANDDTDAETSDT